jgi:AraC-like DNA-binding protein
VQPAIDRALNIVISDGLARKHFPDEVQKEALASFVPDALPLRQGGLLSDDVSLLVYSMLATTRPTIDQVAAAAGVSRRTLSRKLRNEGESFSSILERTRAQIAIERLRSEPAMSVKDIATELGYSDQATLTRMVKRWTGQTPSSIRKCVQG